MDTVTAIKVTAPNLTAVGDLNLNRRKLKIENLSLILSYFVVLTKIIHSQTKNYSDTRYNFSCFVLLVGSGHYS